MRLRTLGIIPGNACAYGRHYALQLNSFDRRKRLVFQSDSLVVRATRGVSTLSGVTRDVNADADFCYLGGYARRGYTTCSQIAIILANCSLRAGEADPRPSNFVSTTYFKQKARFGSKFLLFPQLNFL